MESVVWINDTFEINLEIKHKFTIRLKEVVEKVLMDISPTYISPKCSIKNIYCPNIQDALGAVGMKGLTASRGMSVCPFRLGSSEKRGSLCKYLAAET